MASNYPPKYPPGSPFNPPNIGGIAHSVQQAQQRAQQQAAWGAQNSAQQQQPYAYSLPSPYLPPLKYEQYEQAIAKHKRNKRILVVGAIGGGAIGGAVALGILAGAVALGILAAEHVAVYGGVILRLISGAVAGTIVGAIVGAISLVVIRILAGEEALAFSGGKEIGIVTIAGIVAGATILVPLVTPFVGQFGLLAPCVVAVVTGLIAGALVAGKVRKRPPRRGYVRDR